MTVRQPRQQGLGRGLASLIPQRATPPGTTEIPIARIEVNPYQPRKHMDEADLATLAQSIAEHGVLQPIVVSETLDGFRLVAGERRVRAATMAGLDRIPAVVRQTAEHDQLQLALIENIQRADLDSMEEAHAYRQLIDEFGLSQEDVAARVGRARSTVANTLRLLDLDPTIQDAIADGRITEGHARAIGGLPTDAQPRVLATVVERELSVRETEEVVRRLRQPAKPAVQVRVERRPSLDPDLERVEEDFRRTLGTKVSLARTRRGGRIVIEYYSDDDLGRIYERIVGSGS
jgi:ParB family transcriptional regulator, chromosome partitioning protein